MLKQILPLLAIGSIFLGYLVYRKNRENQVETDKGVNDFERLSYEINSDPNSTWKATAYPKFTYSDN